MAISIKPIRYVPVTDSGDDLGDLSCAAFLRTKSSHTRSTVGHDNFLSVLDGTIGFALHTIPLNS
jgi:hypothetical protein